MSPRQVSTLWAAAKLPEALGAHAALTLPLSKRFGEVTSELSGPALSRAAWALATLQMHAQHAARGAAAASAKPGDGGGGCEGGAGLGSAVVHKKVHRRLAEGVPGVCASLSWRAVALLEYWMRVAGVWAAGGDGDKASKAFRQAQRAVSMRAAEVLEEVAQRTAAYAETRAGSVSRRYNLETRAGSVSRRGRLMAAGTLLIGMRRGPPHIC